jgi:hypothetical protein
MEPDHTLLLGTVVPAQPRAEALTLERSRVLAMAPHTTPDMAAGKTRELDIMLDITPDIMPGPHTMLELDITLETRSVIMQLPVTVVTSPTALPQTAHRTPLRALGR